MQSEGIRFHVLVCGPHSIDSVNRLFSPTYSCLVVEAINIFVGAKYLDVTREM